MITILFVGDTSYDIYVKAFYAAALDLKEIHPKLFDFGCLNLINSEKSILTRIEYRYRIGYHVKKINNSLIEVCKDTIDICFFYSCPFVSAKTIDKIKQLGIYVAIYHNDNPFSDYYKNSFWKKYRSTISKADISYSYRKSDILFYYKFGAKKVELLRSYYINERNYYIDDSKINLYVPDVVFMGHFENDGRLGYIENLLQSNIKVGLPDLWKPYITENSNLTFLPSSHEKYNAILNKAKIAIVFLSTRNKDTYTRRCFEIPICKTMMIIPYNEDLAELFRDGEEAVFYRNEREFIDKIYFYLKHENDRKRIAYSGYKRVLADGHEVHNRLEKIILDFKNSIDEKNS